jgi:hypothetical protein
MHHFLAATELGSTVEVRHLGQLVGLGQRLDDLLVDPVADADVPLSTIVSLKLAPAGTVIDEYGTPWYLSPMYLMKRRTRT